MAYEILSWKVHHALIKAKLEPYLGFLHITAKGKPSLICDFMELYRYLVDDFVVQYCRGLNRKDFILKSDDFSNKRKGKREYLNRIKNREFLKELDVFFTSKIDIPRVERGKKQEIETLISEEALQFARYLREEIPRWNPRIVALS